MQRFGEYVYSNERVENLGLAILRITRGNHTHTTRPKYDVRKQKKRWVIIIILLQLYIVEIFLFVKYKCIRIIRTRPMEIKIISLEYGFHFAITLCYDIISINYAKFILLYNFIRLWIILCDLWQSWHTSNRQLSYQLDDIYILCIYNHEMYVYITQLRLKTDVRLCYIINLKL